MVNLGLEILKTPSRVKKIWANAFGALDTLVPLKETLSFEGLHIRPFLTPAYVYIANTYIFFSQTFEHIFIFGCSLMEA